MHRSKSITNSITSRAHSLYLDGDADLSQAFTKRGSSTAPEGLRQPQGHHEKNSEPAEKHAPTYAERRRACSLQPREEEEGAPTLHQTDGATTS